MAVGHQHLVAGRLEHGGGVAELERQMRVAAAEIDAALIVPGGIDERDPHARTLLFCRVRSSRGSANSWAIQPARSRRPSRHGIEARQPTASVSRRVSATK